MEKEPWKENEGREESILFIFIPFNDSPTSLTHSIDDGEDGREDGNYENRVQSIRLSDYIELQRRLGEGLDPHLHQTEKVGDAFLVFRVIGVSFPSIFRGADEPRHWEKVENRRENDQTRLQISIPRPSARPHSRDNEIKHPRNSDESRSQTSPPIMTVEEISNREIDVGTDVDGVRDNRDDKSGDEKTLRLNKCFRKVFDRREKRGETINELRTARG